MSIFQENFILLRLRSYRSYNSYRSDFFCHTVLPFLRLEKSELKRRIMTQWGIASIPSAHPLSFKLWRLFRVNPRTLVSVGSFWRGEEWEGTRALKDLTKFPAKLA